MPFCKNRVMDNCKKDGRPCIFSEECFEPEESKPITNADRIRAMSDEELKEFLCKITDCSVCSWCSYSGCELMDWLQQTVKEDS